MLAEVTFELSSCVLKGEPGLVCCLVQSFELLQRQDANPLFYELADALEVHVGFITGFFEPHSLSAPRIRLG
jgi:hypothetical protein